MKSIADKLKKTIKVEERKNSTDHSFHEIDQILEKMEKMGYSQKPNYSIPLVDTIGRTTYSTLNKHLR